MNQPPNSSLFKKVAELNIVIPNQNDTFPMIENVIYLDNATMNPIPKTTLRRMQEVMQRSIPSYDLSIHSISREAADLLEQAEVEICKWFGMEEGKIQWAPSRDFATNLAIRSMAKNRKVFMSMYDDLAIHGSSIAMQQKTVLVDERTMTWEEELAEKGENEDIVVINQISPALGTVRDIKKIIEIANDLGLKTVVDFSFSAGQFNVSSYLDEVSVAIIDGTKDLFGPIGSTILIDNTQIERPIFMGTRNILSYASPSEYQINRKSLELGLPNLHSIVGLAQSIRFLSGIGRQAIADKRNELVSKLEDVLTERNDLLRPHISYGQANFTEEKSPIQTFSFPKASAHDFALISDEIFGLKVRSGLLCSHIAMKKLGWNDAVQVSTHCYNTLEDIDFLQKAMDEF
ncbi:MAG: aminotransferase class V-fold PLP-dependent enzyme, partial [Methanobacteriota archaeon]